MTRNIEFDRNALRFACAIILVAPELQWRCYNKDSLNPLLNFLN